MAAQDADMAKAITRAVKAVDASQIFLAPVLSQLVPAARDAGLVVAEEIFADRAYMPDGQLAPRGQEGAVISDPDAALARSLDMLKTRKITALDGIRLEVNPHSLCVHGDGATAVDMARHLKAGLMEAGFTAKTLPEMDLRA